jgi:hypothetical protein
VTIADNAGVVFSSFIYRPTDHLTVLSYSFLKSGTYTMSARFQKGGETLTEVEFPVQVKGLVDQRLAKVAALFGIIGIAIGFGTGRIGKRSTPPSNS